MSEGDKQEGNQTPSVQNDDNNRQSDTPCPPNYLSGIRLHLLTTGLCLALFLINLEVSIVSTSLVAITNDLRGFNRSTWIVTGYLVTYTAFIIIWAKLSDILGRRLCILSTLITFTAFSAGCGASQTMSQLITCRVFQGIGAAGCYSLAVVIMFEMVPRAKYALYGSLMSACVSISTVLGPIFGGAISDHSTWRWVFLLNVPGGLVTAALLRLTIPRNFPRHGQPSDSISHLANLRLKFSKTSLQKLDALGTFFMLSASLLLVTALLEVDTNFAWSSPAPIILLVLSGVMAVSFLSWEYLISREGALQEPIFPWRFITNRPWLGMILGSFLVGVPFNVLIIDLPQRFQTVNGLSPLDAGFRLIPYSFGPPVGSLVANMIASKTKFLPIHLLLIGATLQVVGLGLMITTPVSSQISNAQYGYEVVTGLGVGVVFGILLLLTPFAVASQDLATATGATIQFRMLGGAIGLAIAGNVMNAYLTSHLGMVLPASQVKTLLQDTNNIKSLSPATQEAVRNAFANGYKLQTKITTGLAAAQFPAILLLWKRKQLIARA